MKEILINDLINNMKGYKLLFNKETKENLIKFEVNETINELVVELINNNSDSSIVFVIDKDRKFITYTMYSEGEKDFVQFRNVEAFEHKSDEEMIDELNVFVTEVLEAHEPVCVGIFQEIDDEHYKLLGVKEDATDDEVWEALLSKEVRCRYCDELMDKDKGVICKNGDGYREQDWYVKFKNDEIMNLWDYFEFNINSNEMSNYQSIRILNYELKDRMETNKIHDKFTERELEILENAVHEKEDFLNELDSIKFHLDEHIYEAGWINGQGSESEEYLEEVGVVRDILNALAEDEGEELYRFLVENNVEAMEVI